jgi:HAD superfamily hydrolase (TIGR01509 family)
MFETRAPADSADVSSHKPLSDSAIQVIESKSVLLPAEVRAVAIDFDLTIAVAEEMHERTIFAALGSLLPANFAQIPPEIKEALKRACFGVPEINSFQNGAELIKQKLLLPDLKEAGSSASQDFEQRVVESISPEYLVSLRAELLKWWLSLIEQKSPLAEFNNIEEIGIYPVPHIDGLIRKVNARGVPIAVCTNSGEGVVAPILNALGLGSCFSVATYAGDPDLRAPKPAPDPYLLTFRKLNLDPLRDDIAVFEDSLTGVVSALRAGAHVFVRPSEGSLQDFADRLKEALLSLPREPDEISALKPVTVVACWSQVKFADELSAQLNCSVRE